MNRRKVLELLGKSLIGAEAARFSAPIIDFFWDAPTKSVNTAARGLLFGHGQAVAEMLNGKKAGWPYLHALCHAYAVASMRVGGASNSEAAEWSKWGGIQDELTQQYWAQHYRKVVHTMFVKGLIENERTEEYTHMMQFCWGTAEQKKRAEKRIRLFRGLDTVRSLESLDRLVHASRDACESAFQASDEVDNETGRMVGLQCPLLKDDEVRLAWCRNLIESVGILPETPEGPETDRPWGPFHPLHPGPSWEFVPEQEDPHPLLEP